LKKRIILTLALLLIVITGVVYKNTNYKDIEEIVGFRSSEITKVSFQYNNPAIKGGTTEDKEKIKEFLHYMGSCVFSKKQVQTPVTGYYQMAVFTAGNNEVFRMSTYDNFIDINGTQYNMKKNKLSLDKIDDFIKTLK
jgi:hypothetical protein